MEIIVKELSAMKAVCFEGFKPEPENKATAKMETWCKENHYENKPYRIFGHNIDIQGNLSCEVDNVGYKIYVTIPDDFRLENNVKSSTIEAGVFVVTGIEGNFETDPSGKWITEGWNRLQTMISKKNYKIKCPGRWFEEVLKPSKPNNLRLDLYLEIEK